MSNILVKYFNYSKKLCSAVNLKLKLIKYSFANFHVYLLKESTNSRQDLDKLVTSIPQLIKYGDFCKIISTPVKQCILKKLLSFGSVTFTWEQNV